jgi:hypothetical protein
MQGCVCLLWAALAAQGKEPAGPAPEPPANEAERPERLSGASPVELIPRIELRHRFVEPDAGGALQVTTLRMDITMFHRLLLRYELPRATLSAAGQQRSGFGDITLQAITLLSSGPRHAAVLTTGLVLDSATQPPLGAGKQQVVFGGAGGFKPKDWWLAFAVLEQQISYEGDAARPDVNQLLIRAGSLLFGPQHGWCQVNLDTVIDFQGDDARLLGALEVGRLLFGKVGLFVRGGTHLVGERQLDYFLDAGVRYLFALDRNAASSQP